MSLASTYYAFSANSNELFSRSLLSLVTMLNILFLFLYLLKLLLLVLSRGASVSYPLSVIHRSVSLSDLEEALNNVLRRFSASILFWSKSIWLLLFTLTNTGSILWVVSLDGLHSTMSIYGKTSHELCWIQRSSFNSDDISKSFWLLNSKLLLTCC